MEQGTLTFETPRRTYKVSELTAEIKTLLEQKFGSVWVEGEVSNLRSPSSGHLYFTLKDEAAQIRCVMFKYQARLLRFKIADGQKFVVRARMGVYEARGEYQLVVDSAEPLGVGALELAFRQLKERLAAEGLFDPSRKKPVPHIPRRVGVITSRTGAAIRDIVRTVKRRSKLVDLLLVPVRVQGEGSAREIANAIRLLNSDNNPWGGLDVIIIGRGGGSLEDLWAFNEEELARAVATSKIPVISAVGHETDFVITDFVADERCATPTAAAERVSPLQSDIERLLATHRSRMANALTGVIRNFTQQTIGLRRLIPDPRRDLENRAQRLDDIIERFQYRLRQNMITVHHHLNVTGHMLIRTPLRERMDRRREKLDRTRYLIEAGLNRRVEKALANLTGKKTRLEAINPLAVLQRGYAIARKLPEGQILKDSNQVSHDDRIEIILHKGKIRSRVEKTDP